MHTNNYSALDTFKLLNKRSERSTNPFEGDVQVRHGDHAGHDDGREGACD